MASVGDCLQLRIDGKLLKPSGRLAVLSSVLSESLSAVTERLFDLNDSVPNQKLSYSAVASSPELLCSQWIPQVLWVSDTKHRTAKPYTHPIPLQTRGKWNEGLKFNDWPYSESVGMSEACTGLQC